MPHTHLTVEKLNQLNIRGRAIHPDSPEMQLMLDTCAEARRLNARYNNSDYNPELLKALLGQMMKQPVAEGVRVNPPFYVDYGRNLHIKHHVLIHSGCYFQDQGGIFIGERVSVGHNVKILTLNHGLLVKDRANLYPQSVSSEADVWIGAGAIILPGTWIFQGAVIAAGAVVRGKVPPFTLVAGNPAKVVREIPGITQEIADYYRMI